MKTITFILTAIAFTLITFDGVAQNSIRQGIVVETESTTTTTITSSSSIGLGSFSAPSKVGLVMDIETGEVYPFEMKGIEKDDIKRGMLVSFIVPPGADVAAAHNNNTRAPINFVYDKDAAQ